MRRAAISIVALLGAGACAKQQSFIQLPNEIDFVALIALDASGALIRATPLEDYDANDPPAYAVDPDATLYFVGWSSDQLSTLASKIVSTERLEAASGCRNRLPAPAYYAKIDGDRLAAADGSTAPALGAAWLDAACEPSDTPTDAIVECDHAVRAMLIETGPCAYSVQREGSDPLPMILRPDGTACVESSTPLSCENPILYATGHRLLCETRIEDCSFLLYQRPAEPSYTEDDIVLANVSPFVPELLRIEGDLGRDNARPAYAFDLLPLGGDTLLVTLDSVLDAAHDCTTQLTPPPAELRAYDATTLALRWSRPAPPCLSSLVADPLGSGFLGVYRSMDELALGRFDADGALVMSATIAPNAQPTYVYQSLILEDRMELALVLHALPLRTIISFDLATFEEKARAPSAYEMNSVAQLDPTHLVFAADPNASRCQWNMADFAAQYCAESDCFPQQWLGFTHELFDYYRDAGRNLELVSVSLGAASIWVCGQGDAPGSITFFERVPQPGFMYPHPLDPGLLLVSGIALDALGELGGTLDVVDIDRRRILPGTVPLEGMFTGRIRADDRGRLWLLHPWNATVARLTPKPDPR